MLFPAAAVAATPRDADRDRMPDAWERKHGLKAGKNDSRLDRDRDGLRNVVEFRIGTDPRRRDTDGDRIKDRDELIGVVTAVRGNWITIRLARGGTVRAERDIFTDCTSGASTPMTRAQAGEDDQEEPDEGEDPGDDSSPDDDPADDPPDTDGDEPEATPDADADADVGAGPSGASTTVTDRPRDPCELKPGTRLAGGEEIGGLLFSFEVR